MPIFEHGGDECRTGRYTVNRYRLSEKEATHEWGLTISSGAQRRWGWLCAVVFFCMLLVGSLALVATIAGGHYNPP